MLTISTADRAALLFVPLALVVLPAMSAPEQPAYAPTLIHTRFIDQVRTKPSHVVCVLGETARGRVATIPPACKPH